MRFSVPSLLVAASAYVLAQDACVSSILAGQPPVSGTGIVLQSYELCSNGSLFASAYVEVSTKFRFHDHDCGTTTMRPSLCTAVLMLTPTEHQLQQSRPFDLQQFLFTEQVFVVLLQWLCSIDESGMGNMDQLRHRVEQGVHSTSELNLPSYRRGTIFHAATEPSPSLCGTDRHSC